MMHNPSTYDSREAMERGIQSLDALRALEVARRRAGYDREERLTAWVLLGRYLLDESGNLMIGVGHPFVADVPVVFRAEHISLYFGEGATSAGWTLCSLPRTNYRCPECHLGWTLETAHDCLSFTDHVVALPPDLIGESFEAVRAYFAYQAELEGVEQVRILSGERCLRRGGVWRDPVPGERLEVDDELGAVECRFFHKACYKTKRNREEEEAFSGVFEKAGYRSVHFSKIPNEYCPCDYCATWFQVSTEVGIFHVGRRKRVVSIDWSHTGKDFSSLFEDHNVTRWVGGIHAWSLGDMANYLRRIRKSVF